MKTIQDSVHQLIYNDEEALYALAKGYMNLSAYADIIHTQVETETMKDVKTPSIVVALSRIQKTIGAVHPLVENVELKNITTKSPLSEIVFEKTEVLLDELPAFYEKVRAGSDDFLSTILSTTEITMLCSDRIRKEVLFHFKQKPKVITGNLASIGLSIDEKYYPMSNITFSLLRKIAEKHIPLAETVTTHAEIIFVFDKQYLAEIVGLFQDNVG